jgi:hypothetical protein
MLSETATAITGLKGLYDLAKGFQAMKTDAEIRQATAEMLSALIDVRHQVMAAQEAEEALLKKVRDLEEEITRLKAWDGEKQRYELKRYHPGSFAYALKEGMEAGEPPHRLCPRCYQETKKSLLQATGEIRMRDRVHVCPACKTEVVMGPEYLPGEG